MKKFVKKFGPVVGMMAVYLRWIKPRLPSADAAMNSKSLLLHLLARSAILIPMVVFMGYWLTDSQSDVETLAAMLSPDEDSPPYEFDDDIDDIDDLVSGNSTNGSSIIMVEENIENALRDFQEAHDSEGMFDNEEIDGSVFTCKQRNEIQSRLYLPIEIEIPRS